ncbi:hypothetical protein EBU99_05020 [bacterium]|nr:hypothetical protein [bacterium]
MSHDPLLALRCEIDAVDEQILALIKNRMTIAKQMGALKRATQRPLRDTVREQQILEKLNTLNNNSEPKLAEHLLEDIFKRLMTACLEIQN